MHSSDSRNAAKASPGPAPDSFGTPPWRSLPTAVDTAAEEFKANRSGMLSLVGKLESKLEACRFAGREKHIAKARDLGKHTARERIELLLDPESPFLELLPLTGLGGVGFGPGGTTVAGLGIVCGRLVLVIANKGTLKGGAIDHATLQKALRLNEIAMQNRLPVINLVESSGANLPEQEKIFNYGGINFRELTRRSQAGIPSISVVFGNATAGGAYIPGLSDYAIFVRDRAKVFLAGPPLVKMATNEETDDESLGGAAMHSRVSGVSDYLAENELDGIRLAREIVAGLHPPSAIGPSGAADPPLHKAEELLGIVSPDPVKPIDALEVIARLVDGSRFHAFKPDYGPTLICGRAHIHGYPVGVLANQGVLFSESANKGAHFIQLCNRENVPLLFLQHISGFMVGRKYEEGGIIKDGAKMINAVSNSSVPAITVIMGASYGAGNYAMCGRAYEPRFLFSWPNSRIAVMGSEQLSGVMGLIQREAARKAGLAFDEDQAAQMREVLMQDVDRKSDAWYATGQGWDDGVIDPRDTRHVLGMCLAAVNQVPVEGTDRFGVFRM